MMDTSQSDVIIRIDNLLPLIDTPHYCRNNEEKVRWLAWSQGLISEIRPSDKVVYIPEINCFELTHS